MFRELVLAVVVMLRSEFSDFVRLCGMSSRNILSVAVIPRAGMCSGSGFLFHTAFRLKKSARQLLFSYEDSRTI